MRAAPAAVVADTTAKIIRPRVESWMRTGARLEMEAIERHQDRLARAIEYLERRLARRGRPIVEQLQFDFGR
jgi:hypothetical protein